MEPPPTDAPAPTTMELFPTKVPLPANPFNLNQTDSNPDPSSTRTRTRSDAYRLCLSMERKRPNDKSFVVPARFLGYLLIELPEAGGRVVAREVVNLCSSTAGGGGGDSDDGDEDEMLQTQLQRLAEFYITRLVALLKTKNEGIPYSSPSPDEDRLGYPKLSEEADPAPTDYWTARQSAFVRDNFRCVMTGDADTQSLHKMNEEQLEKFHLTPTSHSGPTKLCFIFSPSIRQKFEELDDQDQPDENRVKSPLQQRWSSSLPEILQSFDIDLDALVKGSRAFAFSLTNGFTANPALCGMFEGLDIWFESLPNQPNTYQIRCPWNDYYYLHTLPPDQRVTFTSTDPALPLPDPRYLRYHAAICRVLHLSDVYSCLEQLQEELCECDSGVGFALAQDGSPNMNECIT